MASDVAVPPAPYYADDLVTLYHGDCREILPELSAVTAVVTDPPYGVAYRPSSSRSCRTATAAWEPIIGDSQTFDPSHLLGYRCTVIFGANHFADRLPPSPTWLVWDKLAGLTSKREIGFNDQADCEMAWVSPSGPARLFSYRWMGLLRDSGELRHERFHPTQKPLALMRWTLIAATRSDDIICDPYAGSGTTLRAAKDLGRRSIGIEIEERYCEVVVRRLAQEVFDFGEAS